MSRDGHLPPGTRQSDIDRHHDGSAYGYEPDDLCPECWEIECKCPQPDAPQWKSRRHR